MLNVLWTPHAWNDYVWWQFEDRKTLKQTVYLMQSPANARHLRESIARHRAGEGVVHDLIELDED